MIGARGPCTRSRWCLAHVRLSDWCGFRFLGRAATEARIAFAPQRQHLQTEGSVHGGVLATLAHSAAVWLVQPELAAGQTMTSIEFRLDFLRAALPERGDLEARATLVKRGRGVAVCEVDVRQGEALIPKGRSPTCCWGGRASSSCGARRTRRRWAGGRRLSKGRALRAPARASSSGFGAMAARNGAAAPRAARGARRRPGSEGLVRPRRTAHVGRDGRRFSKWRALARRRARARAASPRWPHEVAQLRRRPLRVSTPESPRRGSVSALGEQRTWGAMVRYSKWRAVAAHGRGRAGVKFAAMAARNGAAAPRAASRDARRRAGSEGLVRPRRTAHVGRDGPASKWRAVAARGR